MKVIKGKNNFAKVYTDEVEQTALDQIELLCDQPWTKGLQIRIMPDVHAGAGCTKSSRRRYWLWNGSS